MEYVNHKNIRIKTANFNLKFIVFFNIKKSALALSRIFRYLICCFVASS